MEVCKQTLCALLSVTFVYAAWSYGVPLVAQETPSQPPEAPNYYRPPNLFAKRIEFRMIGMASRDVIDYGVSRARSTSTHYVRCACKGFSKARNRSTRSWMAKSCGS